MNFQQDYTQVTDLPLTFLREDNGFISWLNSLVSGIYSSTGASDATMNQILSVFFAQDGWIDTWGLLFSVPRMLNEANAHYANRIVYTVLAGAGPPVAIAVYILMAWGIQAQIVEVFGQVGYTIQFGPALPESQIAAIINSLARIRPAGVPILGYNAMGQGLYLDTINFLNAPSVEGAYLPDAAGNNLLSIGVGAVTNNSVNLLPTWLLTDPVLNGSV